MLKATLGKNAGQTVETQELKATLDSEQKQMDVNLGPKNSGLSAYEVWLSAGNVGTVEEFLESLQGKDYVPTDEDLKKIARQAAKMVEIPEMPDIPEGVATEEWVKEYAQPKGEYISKEQLESAVEDAVKDLDIDVDLSGLATKEELDKVEEKIPDQLADLQGDANHRTVTDTEKQSWSNKSDFSGNYNDLHNKPAIPQVPTKVSAFSNDAGYITEGDIPDSLPASDVPEWAKQPDKPSYTKEDVGLGNVDNVKRYSASNPPPYPVLSVNGKTGNVDVEPKGTGEQKVAEHNTSEEAHNDIRLILENLITKVNTLLDSDDTTLDQTKEIVAYIKANRELLESVTTSKVNVSDVIDNLTTSVSNKPLSAKQGVQLKALIDAIKVPTKLSELTDDSTHRTVTDAEKSTWNAKSDFSGSYDDLTNKPSIPQVPANVSAFTNDAGYMKSSEQQTVIDKALAQAKASGEFDGKDGYTPQKDIDYFDGKDGKNPVKGTDYFTPEEIQSIVAEVQSKATQLKPLYAESLEWLNENGDTSKVYILPDGMIYAYMLTEVETESGGYTNLLPTATMGSDQSTGWVAGAGYTQQARLSGSSGTVSPNYTSIAGVGVTGYIPVKVGDVVRIKGFYPPTGVSTYVVSYKGTTKVNNQTFNPVNDVASGNSSWQWTEGTWYSFDKLAPIEDVTATITLTSALFGADFNAIRISGIITENTIITVNEEIKENSTTTITDYAWTSTGHEFIPADYEDRIIDLETTVAKHNTQINALEKAVKTGGADASKEEAYNRIKEWKYPIHEDAPVFLLETNKPAIASNEQTTEAVYAKYDALMNSNAHYISKVNMGMASDGTTPIYVYHFKEPTPHYSSANWSETKPVILICSGVHPTEQSGVHSLYYAMEEITTNPKLLDLRRNVHFVVMPMINPTGFTDTTYGVRNPNGIQVHYNFEVDFKYPTDSGYVANGNRNHGGETPLSIPETQYFDELMETYKDTLAIVISCHNNDVDEQYGTGFIWCSCATHFMCNLGFRFVDKMSAAWREKYGIAFDEGIRWANDYALAQAEAGSSLFNPAYIKEQPSWDYRVGRASISGSGGTEYKQALKYGVHGINVEVCDRCMVLDKNFSSTRTSNVTTMGAETYINFFRTFMAAYDPKNKKDYAPNLPWED